MQEGSRRMKALGRTITVVALIVIAVAAVTAVLFQFTDLALHSINLIGLLPLAALAFYALIAGALLWITGYIVEGFAAPRSSPPASE